MSKQPVKSDASPDVQMKKDAYEAKAAAKKKAEEDKNVSRNCHIGICHAIDASIWKNIK